MGEWFRIMARTELPGEPLDLPYPPRIIAEAEDFLIVDKPPFLRIHPSKPDEADTLWNELRALLAYEIVNGGQVSIINRLDRETSGLVLVATRHSAASRLSRLMERRGIDKEYLALVAGWPSRDEWEVDAALLRQGSVRPSAIYLKQCIHPDGAPSLTRFRVERRFEKEGAPFALVRAFPKTGRMHQIRIHLAESGHPVVGDKIYGADEGCYLEFIKTGWTPALARRLLLARHALHSCALLAENQEWRTGLPSDLAQWSGLPEEG
jgi:23S rRNA pseudouridine1911/1915/1917 synthase